MKSGGGMERASKALSDAGLNAVVRSLPRSTRSACEAAAALGCGVANIAKSLVFKGVDTGLAVMIVMSGVNRVDAAKVAEILGESVEKADAGFVRDKTGYAIGGVAPLGHRESMPILLDDDIFALDYLWAAAGSPNSVFQIAPSALKTITGGRRVSVAE